MQKKYKKSFLLFTHIILGAILAFFTIIAMIDYTKNIFLGMSISIFILVIFFLFLKKSVSLFNQGRIGIAYFLVVTSFFSLMFAQIINCSNSITFYLH